MPRTWTLRKQSPSGKIPSTKRYCPNIFVREKPNTISSDIYRKDQGPNFPLRMYNSYQRTCISLSFVPSISFVLIPLLSLTFFSLDNISYCISIYINRYMGAGGTRTPLHSDRLATSAWNVVVFGDGSKQW